MRHHGRVPAPGVRARDLLIGPRGRELCARLAGIETWEIRNGIPPLTAADLLSRLSQQRSILGFEDGDPLAAVAALADIAEEVNYWGGWPAGPLDDPAVIAELRTIATRVAESAGCQWWWSQAERSAQRYVQWTGHEEPAPEPGNSAETLRLINAEAIELERSMSRDRHLPAGTGTAGPWWSFPFPGLISTTRRVGSLGAVLLAGREDGFGETEAVVRPVVLAEDARVFEIDQPQAWQRLVTDYRRTATATYRHTWAWTGWDGEWLVPHWPAVAADWDGVHLSVAGYLSTAGHPLPVGPARTLLAGWNPDETYWLADVITSIGEAQAWHNPSRDPLGWTMRQNGQRRPRPEWPGAAAGRGHQPSVGLVPHSSE
jgi:hypothetical protein